MTKPVAVSSPVNLRQRMIEDMNVRGFCAKIQHDYLRIVSCFAAFLGRSPGSAMSEDVRRFPVEQDRVPAPAMNSHVAALRCFFTSTLDRPDLSHKLVRVSYPRCSPPLRVLSRLTA
jgi:integrase/recombinase XerD